MGKPSKGTPADRRLKANQPAPAAKKTAGGMTPMKPMAPMPKMPPMRGGKRGK